MSKDRRNSANLHVIRKADPRIDLKVSTAPLPNRHKGRIATGPTQRCKSASNIIHRLKVQQAEEEKRKLCESTISLATLASNAKKFESERDSKLPNITPRPITAVRGDTEKYLPVNPLSNGTHRKGSGSNTPATAPPIRGRPPPEPSANEVSRSLLSSAIRKKRAAALLNQRPMTTMVGSRISNRDSCNTGRKSIDYSELPSKRGVRSVSNLRTAVSADYDKQVRVVSAISYHRDGIKRGDNNKTKPKVSKTPIQTINPSDSSDSDETENDSSDGDESDDESFKEEQRNGFLSTSIKKDHATDNSSSGSEDSDKSETEDDEDSAQSETDKPTMLSDSTISSNTKTSTRNSQKNDSATDDDIDDDNSDVSSNESDDREDVDVEVFIDESLLNKVNLPGLPTLDVHEQVYLATQIKEGDKDISGEVKAKKIKTNAKKAKVTFGDELSNDVDSLLETIDETLLLNKEKDNKTCRLKSNKVQFTDDQTSLSKAESLLNGEGAS